MFVSMNRISVNPDHADAFETRFKNRAGFVDQAPGFIRNMVLRPEDPANPYIITTFWENREAFVTWTKSDAFRQAHAGAGQAPKTMFSGPGKLELFDAVTDSGRFTDS